MKIHAHIIARDDATIFPYTARHYTGFCDRVVLHDFSSTDGTLDIAKQFGVEVVNEGNPEKFDDRDNTRVKNECWLGTDADWVMVVDADELIYFPCGVQNTLDAYIRQGVAVAKPHGFEMLHTAWPTTTGQIYDEVKYGARLVDYDKPVLFTPRLVEKIQFSEGAHVCNGILLKNGNRTPTPTAYTEPPADLLHFHHVGPIEWIASRYDIRTARHSEANTRNHWGNQKPGMEHALEKRSLIMSRLERVVL